MYKCNGQLCKTSYFIVVTLKYNYATLALFEYTSLACNSTQLMDYSKQSTCTLVGRRVTRAEITQQLHIIRASVTSCLRCITELK